MSSEPIRNQFVKTLLEVGKKDSNLVVMVGDISHFRLQPFAEACAGRYYNIGICEPTILSMAAGLSKMGLHPVVHTIAPFILDRSFEQIKLDFCYQQLGGNLMTVGSAFDYSNLGCTHHCYHDAALLKVLEGAQITFPGSSEELDVLFKETYDNNQLTLFRIPTHSHDYQMDKNDISFGKGVRIKEGNDLTLITAGPQLNNVLAAYESLTVQGWNPEVIYLPTLWPLDTELICESIKKTKRVLTVEEHVRSGGLGNDILFITKDILDVQYSLLCIPDHFIRGYCSYEEHCQNIGLSKDGIIKRVNEDFRK